ncbi:MAG TPA: hypothetical protein VKD91_09025, partial [Pyrinomonadaceae bacterium]|nr:hypothetical protein [Pyrinomonadaceae bacterium]
MLLIKTDGWLRSCPALVLIDSWKDALDRIWHVLNDPHKIGNLQVSVTTLIEGLLIFAVALFVSRTLSAILQRRIARRAYLDPGLQYTLGRLIQYLILMLGVLIALNAALNVDLTSIAVAFTALSVGIGF